MKTSIYRTMLAAGVGVALCASVALGVAQAQTPPATTTAATTTTVTTTATTTTSTTATSPASSASTTVNANGTTGLVNSDGSFTLTAPASTGVVGIPYVPTTAVSVTTTTTTTPVTSTVAPAATTNPDVNNGGGTSSPAPEVVSVDMSGNVLLRGWVTAVNASTLQINSWGGTWTVDTRSAQATAGASGIVVGDFVGVSGIMTPGIMWSVNAAIVRDWTAVPGAAVSASTGSVSMTAVPAGDTLYTGTVSDASALSSNSFVLTMSDGTTKTVNVASDATIWDSARTDMSLSDIEQNDSINIDGSMQSDGTISADVLRDTSR